MGTESETSVEGDAHAEHSAVTLDVRELPPPKPLRRTLERLAELEDGTSLVQLNDRAPQHLYPKLEDRGYTYETDEEGDVVRTVIQRAE
jgi:uncharacterized protein (DUF2249 family)